MEIRHFKEHSKVQLKNTKLLTSETFTDWCVQTDNAFDDVSEKQVAKH